VHAFKQSFAVLINRDWAMFLYLPCWARRARVLSVSVYFID